MESIGRAVVLTGILLIIIGIILIFIHKIPLIGRLPGDIHIQRKNFTLYFPITTCIVISLILTLIMYLLHKR